MASLQEIIDRAGQAALVGTDGSQSPLVDSALTAETIYPHAVRYAFSVLADGDDLGETLSEHSVSIVAGVGVLPDALMKSLLDYATFPGRQFVSLVPYEDFQRYRFSPQLDYLAIVGKKVYFAQAGTASYSGNLVINAPTIPLMPTNIKNDLGLPEKIVEHTILIIAAVLRGEMRLAQLAV